MYWNQAAKNVSLKQRLKLRDGAVQNDETKLTSSAAMYSHFTCKEDVYINVLKAQQQESASLCLRIRQGGKIVMWQKSKKQKQKDMYNKKNLGEYLKKKKKELISPMSLICLHLSTDFNRAA